MVGSGLHSSAFLCFAMIVGVSVMESAKNKKIVHWCLPSALFDLLFQWEEYCFCFSVPPTSFLNVVNVFPVSFPRAFNAHFVFGGITTTSL